MKKLKFANGDQLDAIGLGTWKSDPGDVYQAVISAVDFGYRHIDCAPVYANENEVGDAFKKLFSDQVIKREDIWVTSKLWNNAHRENQVLPALEQTLKDLKLDYLDLYLIHWPVSLKAGVGFPQNPSDFLSYQDVPLAETWSAMEKAVEKGMAKHIGVSNFNQAKITEVLENASIKPAMNQVEMHPYLPQHGLVDFCKNKEIHLTAYSPLGSRDRSRKKDDEPNLFDDPVINEIAEKYQATAAQILISWAVHRGTAVIPKSVNPERIKQNFESVNIELNEEDMAKINKIDHAYRFVDGTFWAIEGSPYQLSDLWD